MRLFIRKLGYTAIALAEAIEVKINELRQYEAISHNGTVTTPGEHDYIKRQFIYLLKWFEQSTALCTKSKQTIKVQRKRH